MHRFSSRELILTFRILGSSISASSDLSASGSASNFLSNRTAGKHLSGSKKGINRRYLISNHHHHLLLPPFSSTDFAIKAKLRCWVVCCLADSLEKALKFLRLRNQVRNKNKNAELSCFLFFLRFRSFLKSLQFLSDLQTETLVLENVPQIRERVATVSTEKKKYKAHEGEEERRTIFLKRFFFSCLF